MDDENAMGPWVRRVRHFGNNNHTMAFWAAVGVTCATMAPYFVVCGDVMCAMVAPYFVVMCCIYWTAWNLRETGWMRERRGWFPTAIFNCILICLALMIVMRYDSMESENWIIFWMLVALAVFALEELAKPIFDFGILMFLLQMPTLLAIYIIRRQYSGYYLAIAVLWVFCIVWQSYYMHVFNEERERNRRKKEMTVQLVGGRRVRGLDM